MSGCSDSSSNQLKYFIQHNPSERSIRSSTSALMADAHAMTQQDSYVELELWQGVSIRRNFAHYVANQPGKSYRDRQEL
jgi:hypothetical protein